MKKIVLSLILGAALVGCGGVEPEMHTTPEGQSMFISIGDEIDSSTEPGTVSASSCLVTLQWCKEPTTREPSCRGSSGCTIQQVIDSCAQLIRQTC